jgi:exodeoxyribonuclease VII large subunit
MLDHRSEQVSALRARTARTLAHRLERAGSDLSHTLARLRALSPAATLERGYAVVRRGSTVLRDAAQAAPGDELRIRLAVGELTATVTEETP